MKKLNTALKLTAIAAVAMTLVACGGGGGGSPIAQAPSGQDPSVQVVAPSPVVNSITSNASSDSVTVDAALPNRAGATPGSTPVTSSNTDNRGVAYATLLSGNATLQGFTGGLTGLNGKTLIGANSSVIAAHKLGWTGKDQNVLIMDKFSPAAGQTVAHGGVVAALAARYAPGANYTSFDTLTGGYGTWKVADESFVAGSSTLRIENTTLTTNGKGINYQVANLSFGVPNQTYANSYRDIFKWNNSLVGTQVQNGTPIPTLIYNRITTSDAVIVKASGNATLALGSAAAITADALTPTLMADNATKNRTLLVGALQYNASAPTGQIANYSNRAGTDSLYANNFVVASGTDPFSNYSGEGTSYAAPRVAGYVALVRQKFSAVNGAQAAGIILDTARWNGTWGTDNATNRAIYGKGEASISHALAPTTRLR